MTLKTEYGKSKETLQILNVQNIQIYANLHIRLIRVTVKHKHEGYSQNTL